MNKPLFDFLDKCEGKPEGTSTANIKKEFKRQGYTMDNQTRRNYITT